MVSQDIPLALATQGRPLRGRPCVGNEEGMSWETTDVLSADTTDVLSADTTDVVCRQNRWLVYTLFECWRPGIGPQSVSGRVCEALASPGAKKERPFEIIILTNPKLASG